MRNPRIGKLPGQRQFRLGDAAAADEGLLPDHLAHDERQQDERAEDDQRCGEIIRAVPERGDDPRVAVIIEPAEHADDASGAAADKGRLHDEAEHAFVAQGLHFAEDRHLPGESCDPDFRFSFHGHCGEERFPCLLPRGVAGVRRRFGDDVCRPGDPVMPKSGRKGYPP